VQLIKALLDYTRPTPDEETPPLRRIEIIMPDEHDSAPHEFIEVTGCGPDDL
jgi:hypothetical protein